MDDSERLRAAQLLLSFVHAICLFSLAAASVYAYSTVKPPGFRMSWLEPVTLFTALLTCMFIFFSIYSFRLVLRPASQTTSLKKKLSYYRSGHIRRCLLLSVAGALPLLLVWFEQSYWYYLFSGAAALVLIMTWPTLNMLKTELRLN